MQLSHYLRNNKFWIGLHHSTFIRWINEYWMQNQEKCKELTRETLYASECSQTACVPKKINYMSCCTIYIVRIMVLDQMKSQWLQGNYLCYGEISQMLWTKWRVNGWYMIQKWALPSHILLIFARRDMDRFSKTI